MFTPITPACSGSMSMYTSTLAARPARLLVAALLVALGGCGGSTATPRDGGADTGKGTGGAAAAGTGGATGVPLTGGASGAASGGAMGQGAGGATTPGAGGSGAGGSAGGTGGQSGDAGGDAPGTQDTTFPFDLPIPSDIALPDGAPAIVPCPVDVATAACTNNTVCIRPGATPSACGCTMQRWFCPGADAGAPPGDASFPDVPGVAACPTGIATAQPCAAENEVCAGGPGLGCACVPLLGSLRWFCL
jgi:hypothetical protein